MPRAKEIHIPSVDELRLHLKRGPEPIFIGVDPGASGGAGAIYPGGFAEAWRLPRVKTKPADADINGSLSLFHAFGHKDIRRRVQVVVEKTNAIRGDTPKTAFAMGRYRMLWEVIFSAYNIPWDFVSPRKWKNALGLSSNKDESLRLARRLFPDVELPNKCDHDKAEGLLLADYLRRTRFGNMLKPGEKL